MDWSRSIPTTTLPIMSIIVTTTSTSDCCWIPSNDIVVVTQQQQQQQQKRRRNINLKRRVTFCCSNGDEEHPVTDVIEVTHNYPSDYFYTRSDMARFRREVSEERRQSSINAPCCSSSSTLSLVERALNFATSSLLVGTLVIIALLATTIASLPILLLLKIVSLLLPYLFGKEGDDEDVDSSIRPYSPPSSSSSLTSKTSFSMERIMYSIMGDTSSSFVGATDGEESSLSHDNFSSCWSNSAHLNSRESPC